MNSKIKKGLGRGLSSLIGETKVEVKTNKLLLSDIIPNKYQPRKNFEKENLEDLKTTLSETYHYPGCKTCWHEDKKNIRSRRVAQNQFSNDNALSTAKLQSLGVRYGTLCNSKCMICSHHRSSSWVADAEKLGLTVDERYKYKKIYYQE